MSAPNKAFSSRPLFRHREEDSTMFTAIAPPRNANYEARRCGILASMDGDNSEAINYRSPRARPRVALARWARWNIEKSRNTIRMIWSDARSGQRPTITRHEAHSERQSAFLQWPAGRRACNVIDVRNRGAKNSNPRFAGDADHLQSDLR